MSLLYSPASKSGIFLCGENKTTVLLIYCTGIEFFFHDNLSESLLNVVSVGRRWLIPIEDFYGTHVLLQDFFFHKEWDRFVLQGGKHIASAQLAHRISCLLICVVDVQSNYNIFQFKHGVIRHHGFRVSHIYPCPQIVLF